MWDCQHSVNVGVVAEGDGPAKWLTDVRKLVKSLNPNPELEPFTESAPELVYLFFCFLLCKSAGRGPYQPVQPSTKHDFKLDSQWHPMNEGP